MDLQKSHFMDFDMGFKVAGRPVVNRSTDRSNAVVLIGSGSIFVWFCGD